MNAKTRYSEFVNADYGHSFAEWLGITVPVLDTRYDFRNGHQYQYSRWYGCTKVCGTWEKTMKAAKASYKAAVAAHKKYIKQLLEPEEG